MGNRLHRERMDILSKRIDMLNNNLTFVVEMFTILITELIKIINKKENKK